MPYAGDPNDYRTMAAAMQSMAGDPAGQQTPGMTPPPMLTGSGPITPPQTTRGSMANAGLGSTGGDAANTANMTGDGGATQQLVMIVQQLAQMLGRPPSQQEVEAYLHAAGAGDPAADLSAPALDLPDVGELIVQLERRVDHVGIFGRRRIRFAPAAAFQQLQHRNASPLNLDQLGQCLVAFVGQPCQQYLEIVVLDPPRHGISS
jgi:hypothetical protein